MRFVTVAEMAVRSVLPGDHELWPRTSQPVQERSIKTTCAVYLQVLRSHPPCPDRES